jgi:hypothetical protein
VTFQNVPTAYSGGVGKLQYSAVASKPARRIVVQAVDNCDRAVAETSTDDLGAFRLSVPGNEVRVKAVSRMVSSDFSVERGLTGRSYLSACNTASWDFSVVDNTHSQSPHAYSSNEWFTASSSALAVQIPLEEGTQRPSGAFAIADSILSSFEQVCKASPATAFAKLMINWSTQNYPSWGEKSKGAIGTSHFTVEAGRPQLYILGKADVDTDEYDSHIIAHEFGHYLEYTMYRSDTLGGSHSLSDRLDPRVAFSEGFGNAYSAIAMGSPTYVDSMGLSQQEGYGMSIDSNPVGMNYNGLQNEHSVQYLLYQLYQGHNGGSYSRIHEILRNYQSVATAFTTAQTFASFYNERFGDAILRPIWENALDTPYDALCTATTCAGTGSGSGDVADPFDSKRLIGARYALNRTYGGSGRNAYFWDLYRSLSPGLNPATDHDVIHSGGSSYPLNKRGYIRWYRYTHTAATAAVTVNVENVAGVGTTCSANDSLPQSQMKDWMDLFVYGPKAGTSGLKEIASDTALTGCPRVAFIAQQGATYLLTVNGQLYSGGNVSGYDLRVSY